MPFIQVGTDQQLTGAQRHLQIRVIFAHHQGVNKMEAEAAKLIGAGLAAIGTGAAGIGVGNLFGQFLQGRDQKFQCGQGDGHYHRQD